MKDDPILFFAMCMVALAVGLCIVAALEVWT